MASLAGVFGCMSAVLERQPLESVLLQQPAPASFEQCYRAHRDEVYRWCLRYGGGRRAWAEDLAHDVFLRLMRQLPRLTRAHELQPWLYRVTANLALNRLRDEQSLLGRLGRLWRPGDEDPAPSPEAGLSLRQQAERSLRALPPRERIPLCMKVLDGKSQKEIADALDMSEGYVSKLLARAWERLRADGWEVDHAP